jgi:hypothetical protein
VLARTDYDCELERQQRLAAEANYLSARELSREVSRRLGLDPESVFNALTFIPDNMLSLLHSPEGWSALAAYAAAELGAADPSYRPTRH